MQAIEQYAQSARDCGAGEREEGGCGHGGGQVAGELLPTRKAQFYESVTELLQKESK